MGLKSTLDNVDPDSSMFPYLALPFANIPDPFNTKKRTSFPMPDEFNEYQRVVNPEDQMEGVENTDGSSSSGGFDDPNFYSPGYNPSTGKKNPMPNVSEITSGEGMSSYIPSKSVAQQGGWRGIVERGIKKELAFPTGFNAITATDRVTDVSGAMGNLPMGAFTLGSLTALGAELNTRNLSSLAANAAVGKEGYALGMFDNQIIGYEKGVPIPQGITSLHPVLEKRVMSQLEKLEQSKSPNKAGNLGRAFTQFTEAGGRFNMSTPMSKEMIAYEDMVKNLKITSSQKAALLGYNPNIKSSKYQSDITSGNYYQITPYEDIVKNAEETENFRNNPQNNLGLETDVAAQDNQITPTAVNQGMDLPSVIDDIKSVPTQVNVPSYTYQDDNSNDGGGSDSSSPSSSDMGFSTAYGGRIAKAYGGGKSTGFVSETPKQITIQGVGLIEPDETFLKTDTVRDRYNLEARENDFIINGPSSGQFEKPILAFINQAEANLKNKGVDIRVGKPTIPKGKQIPLLVASSENYIPKEYIEAFNPDDPEEGYRVLEAMNNAGKPEVTRLKKELGEPTDKSKYKAAEGTKVSDEEYLKQLRKEDGLPEDSPAPKSMLADRGFSSQDLKALRIYYRNSKIKSPQRKDVITLLDSLSDAGAVGLTVLTESVASRDSDDSLRNIANVIYNRVSDKQFDFRKRNTIKDVLKHQTGRGAKKGKLGMFHFDGLEPTSVRNRLHEVFERGQQKALTRALIAAENANSKEPDFQKYLLAKDILFYDKPNSPTSISKKFITDKTTSKIAYADNPLVDKAYEVESKDGHSFYRNLQRPDIPMGTSLKEYNKNVTYQEPINMTKTQYLKYLRNKSKLSKN